MLLRYFFTFTIVYSSAFFLAFSQCKEAYSSRFSTNKEVTCSFLDSINNVLYLGGRFTSVSNIYTRGAMMDPVIGSASLKSPVIYGNTIACSVGDGKGGFYLGGDFTLTEGGPAIRLAHLDSNGQLTALPFYSKKYMNYDQILTLVLDGNKLYIGGSFDTINFVQRDNLACFDLDNLTLTDWKPKTNGRVSEMLLKDSLLLIGGTFTMVNNVSRTNLAFINKTTSNLNSFNAAVNNPVYTLKLYGDTLFIGGSFSQVSGTNRARVAAFDLSTETLLAWNPAPGGPIYNIEVYNEKVYVTGAFGFIGGKIRYNFAELNITSGAASDFNLSFEGGTASVMTLKDSVLYLGGKFGTVYPGGNINYANGKICGNLISLNLNTMKLYSWKPYTGISGGVGTISVSDDKVFTGGSFEFIGLSRDYLAAIDPKTGKGLAFNPNPNHWVNAIEKSGDTLYIAGTFEKIGDSARTYLGAVQATSGNILQWKMDEAISTPNIQTLAVYKDRLYVGGKFDKVGSANRYGLACVDRFTGTLDSWNPSGDISNYISKLMFRDDTLFISGVFSSLSGSPRNNLASMDAATGTLTFWNPNVTSTSNIIGVSDFFLKDTIIYIVGEFNKVGSATRNFIAGISTNTGLPTGLIVNPNSPVSEIEGYGNNLYITGTFTKINGTNTGNVEAVDAVTGALKNWNPTLDGLDNYLGSMLYVGKDMLYYSVASKFFVDSNSHWSTYLGAFPLDVPDPAVSVQNSSLVSAEELGVDYQWKMCNNVPVAGAKDRIFYPSANGSYYVSVTKNHCTVRSNCISFVITGLDEDVTQEETGIRVFPNPSNSNFTLETNEHAESITIINQTGQLIKMEYPSSGTHELSLSDLPEGLYFLKIILSGNEYTFKLIKN